MKLPRRVYVKMVNKQLEPFGIVIDDLENHDPGSGTRKKQWWNIYSFASAEEYEAWRAYCIKEIRVAFPAWDEENVQAEFTEFDSVWGIAQDYLFNKQKQLI